MAEAIQLLIVTVFLRPYVFVFLAFYLTAATIAIGRRRVALFQQVDRALPLERRSHPGVEPIPCETMLYHLIMVFNLVVTFIIDEIFLRITGFLLYTPITWMVFKRYWRWRVAHSVAGCGVLS